MGVSVPDWVPELLDVVVGAAEAASHRNHRRWAAVEPASLSPFPCGQERGLRDPCPASSTKRLSLPTPPLPPGRALSVKRNAQQTMLEESRN